MFGVIMPLCNRMFCCIFGWYISILKSGWNMKKIFCCPAIELFHCLSPLFRCLPLWTTVRLHGKKLQNPTNPFIWSANTRLDWAKSRSTICNPLKKLLRLLWPIFKNFVQKIIMRCTGWYTVDKEASQLVMTVRKV